MSSRKRSIPRKITLLLLLPLLSILALSALAASHALGQSWVALDATAAALGVVAIAVSIVTTIRANRRIASDCRVMTAGVYDFSQRRLPIIAERVRQGVEVQASFDAPDYFFTTKEVETLLAAFIYARDAAVKATIDEGTLRRGVGEVFVNLARRSQTLLHRQLSLLDNMERRADEPEELEDLFRLDHLATRMRRHAEGLVILSGRAPARGWRNPVPFVDVARGAVAEVEDYTRVSVTPMPGSSLAGRAVADLIHLVAELVENATTFSPPHTSVQISGQVVGNGFAIEIEDRGLGLSLEHLNAINRLLADPPEFDLSESSRLGLFVVGHLAMRHGVRVSLRQSPYGGTTAIILIPSALVVDGEAAPATAEQMPEQVPAGVGAPAAVGLVSAEAAAPPPAPSPVPQPPAPSPVPQPPAPSPVSQPPSPGRHAHAGAPQGPRVADQPTGTDQPTGNDPSTENELPRRVRQEHLAPQLREEPPTASDATQRSAEPSGESTTDRSPEQVRETMAALQNGWLRGRNDVGAETDGATGASAPGTRPAREEDA